MPWPIPPPERNVGFHIRTAPNIDRGTRTGKRDTLPCPVSRCCYEGAGSITSLSWGASPDAIPHRKALNVCLTAGRHRQRQHQVSVGASYEERQLSLESRCRGLPNLTRDFPPVAEFAGSAEGECFPAEGPVLVDPGRTADLSRDGLRRRWRHYLIGFDRGLAGDQQHRACAGATTAERKATHRTFLV